MSLVKSLLIHLALFIVAFATTTLAGVQWLNKDPLELTNFSSGLPYSLLLLLVLSSHEFGHYLTARYHNVNVTLPFFIPFPSVSDLTLLNPFGTLGAVIRFRSALPSRKILFDIAAAGPIAGFVVSLFILAAGFAFLPSKEYIYGIHPEYARMESIPLEGQIFGKTILYSLFAAVLPPDGSFVPPMNEMYHYPLLCVGWFGLLVTALNLIPVGQLDGGHISHAMFGEKHDRLAQGAIFVLIVLGILGVVPELGIDTGIGHAGWLVWALILIFLMRVLKLKRAPLLDYTPLDSRRILIGWFCFLIFVVSFSPSPITVVLPP